MKFVLFTAWNLIFIILFCITYVSTEKNVDSVEKVELADNAENVCIDQKMQTQILNTTFIQSQVKFFKLNFVKPVLYIKAICRIFESSVRFV